MYQYNGKYTEHRAAIDDSDSVEAIDVKSIEFNPWQYENLAAWGVIKVIVFACIIFSFDLFIFSPRLSFRVGITMEL